MSDVWQGPGWWLASDGKWYPAEAESGAVYEGEIAGADNSAETPPDAAAPAPVATPVTPTVDPVAAAPIAAETPVAESVVAETVVAAEPVVAAETVVAAEAVVADPTVVAAAPLAFEPVVVEPLTIEPEPVAPTPIEQIAVDDVATTPEAFTPPVVETAPSTGSGWQVIEEAGVAAEEEGWTNAFGETAAPEAAIPDIAAPEAVIPDIAAPEAAIPDIAGPEAVIPDIAAPEAVVASPFDAAPPLLEDVPEVASPDAIPEITIPEVTRPETAVPDAVIPESTISQAASIPTTEQVPLDPYVAPGTPSTAAEPIERTDAWRSPINGDGEADPITAADSGLTPPPTRPDVVDLAIPEAAPTPVVADSGTNWSLIGGALAAVVLLGAIVWLALQLFSNGEGSDTTQTDGDSSANVESEPTTTEGDDTTTDEAVAEDGPELVSVFALRDGDCIVGDITGQILEVEKVDCEQEHQFQVYRETIIDDASITDYDEVAITAFAEDVCRASLEALIPADDDRGINFKFLQPTEDSWNAENPDRVVTCLLFDDDAPLIGRVG